MIIISESIVTTIISLLGGGGILGGIYALLKLRPEAGQITVGAAQGAVVVQTGVIENMNREISRLNDKVAQVEMENAAREQAEEDCKTRVAEMKLAIEYNQRDIDRYGRMTELARTRSHLLSNSIQSFELIIEELLMELNKYNLPITPIVKFREIRKKLRDDLNELAELESKVTYEKLQEHPPTFEPKDETISSSSRKES